MQQPNRTSSNPQTSVIKAVVQKLEPPKEPKSLGVDTDQKEENTAEGDYDYDTIIEGLIEDVAKESFFHGSVSIEEAKEILVNGGDFLVRVPEKTHGQVVVTMRVSNELKDFPIIFLKHGKQLKERLVTINGNYVRNSIIQLIQDHALLEIPVQMSSKLVLGTAILRAKWELPKNSVEMDSVIGEGAFGSVWSGKLKEKEKTEAVRVAIKVTKISANNKVNVDGMLTEAKLMRQLQHTNVVAFHGVILDAGQVMIVMELVNGGGLDKYMKKNKVPNVDKYSYCYDVANGLSYLHSRRFIHRDVAARNCLIDTVRNVVKISDFGMSKQGKQYKILATERTPIRWQAPEVMKTAMYTKECDAYSFAMVMYEIFADGKQPFEGIDNKTIRAKIHDPNFRPPVPPNIPKDIRTVMTLSWAALPKQRITMRFAAFTLSKYCRHNSQLTKLALPSSAATPNDSNDTGKLQKSPKEQKEPKESAAVQSAAGTVKGMNKEKEKEKEKEKDKNTVAKMPPTAKGSNPSLTPEGSPKKKQNNNTAKSPNPNK